MENAKFRIGVDFIEISGSQEFVEGQLQNFKDLIETSYEKILNLPLLRNQGGQNVNKVTSLLNDSNSGKQFQATEDTEFIEVKSTESIDYDSVFVMEGNTFQINCDIPGSSISTKMINVVLIFMWAKLKQGIETMAFSELREACMNSMGSEFDASNFSKCIDHHKRYFLLLGERQNRSAKLIRTGIKEAERLINELNKQ